MAWCLVKHRETLSLTFKTAFRCKSEIWVLTQKDNQRFEAAQLTILTSLLVFTKLDHKRMQLQGKYRKLKI
jgi:hypothetical protein